jgi:hypothetical protein
MSTPPDLAAASLAERVTLLGVTYLAGRDEAPAHAGEIVGTCTWEFDDVDAEVLGNLSEADVSRALNQLEARGAIEQAFGAESSPVGKGRPLYSLAVAPETVLDSYRSDGRLAPLVEYVREKRY